MKIPGNFIKKLTSGLVSQTDPELKKYLGTFQLIIRSAKTSEELDSVEGSINLFFNHRHKKLFDGTTNEHILYDLQELIRKKRKELKQG